MLISYYTVSSLLCNNEKNYDYDWNKFSGRRTNDAYSLCIKISPGELSKCIE